MGTKMSDIDGSLGGKQSEMDAEVLKLEVWRFMKPELRWQQ